jgi:hypothetical protein
MYIAQMIKYKRPEDGCMHPKHVAPVSHWKQLYVVLDRLSINTCLLTQREGIYETK